MSIPERLDLISHLCLFLLRRWCRCCNVIRLLYRLSARSFAKSLARSVLLMCSTDGTTCTHKIHIITYKPNPIWHCLRSSVIFRHFLTTFKVVKSLYKKKTTVSAPPPLNTRVTTVWFFKNLNFDAYANQHCFLVSGAIGEHEPGAHHLILL